MGVTAHLPLTTLEHPEKRLLNSMKPPRRKRFPLGMGRPERRSSYGFRYLRGRPEKGFAAGTHRQAADGTANPAPSVFPT